MKHLIACTTVIIFCCFFFTSDSFSNTTQAAASRQVKITLDDTNTISTYANHVDVKENPEEIIFDFMLIHYQENQKDLSAKPFKRTVLNYYTAKRLMAAIEQTLERHEKSFGVIGDIPNITTDNILTDDTLIVPNYSNFCRVTGTPEEMIIDLSMDPNPYGQNDKVLKVCDRVVINFSTSKQLFLHLKSAIDNFEKKNGKIELDALQRLIK